MKSKFNHHGNDILHFNKVYIAIHSHYHYLVPTTKQAVSIEINRLYHRDCDNGRNVANTVPHGVMCFVDITM